MLWSSYIIKNNGIKFIVDNFEARWRSSFIYASQIYREYLLFAISILGTGNKKWIRYSRPLESHGVEGKTGKQTSNKCV